MPDSDHVESTSPFENGGDVDSRIGGDEDDRGDASVAGDRVTEDRATNEIDDDEFREAAAIAEGAPTSGVSDDGTHVSAGEETDVVAERDEYRDALLRVKAEFDNYRKRTAKEHGDLIARANVALATELLPVLDACDAALDHGASDVEPIFKSLLDILEKEGLQRMDPVGAEFDPNHHEAVAHEDGDGSTPIVTETFRIGYSWRGQIIRAPMVKVRG